jgi:hypothetical protein
MPKDVADAGLTETNLKAASRARWLKQLHQWHWISAGLSLACLLLFSFTGITLNHASQIEARPQVVKRLAVLPEMQRAQLARTARSNSGASNEGNGSSNGGVRTALPPDTEAWLQQTWGVQAAGKDCEWSQDEVYLPLPRPGGDAWVRITLADGHAEYEVTTRGVISLLNDLHKGRNTGPAWNWFIDLFAIACLLFALTGLLILKFHAKNRASTWPLVGLGLLLPVLLALLFIH